MSGAGAAAGHVERLRELLTRNCATLHLDRGSIRSPRPGVIAAVTETGQLLSFEVSVYERGQW